jgi:hypothetical protein
VDLGAPGVQRYVEYIPVAVCKYVGESGQYARLVKIQLHQEFADFPT